MTNNDIIENIFANLLFDDAVDMMNEKDNMPAHEGTMTKAIEIQTAKIPSMAYLSLAMGSIVASFGLKAFTEKKDLANFVGTWAPVFMLFGIYNKLVKLEGSDRFDTRKR